MLVLSRRIGENIKVGEQITLSVLGIKGNSVRIGISAPRELPIHREEIYRKIRKERNLDSVAS